MDNKTDETKSCSNCVYFASKNLQPEHPERRVAGRCRRNAPTHHGFPITYERDYCGEWGEVVTGWYPSP